MKKHALWMILLAIALLLSSCQRSASQVSLPTPTATSAFPIANSDNPMVMLQTYATQTALASTLLPGGGATATPNGSVTPVTLVTGTPPTAGPTSTGYAAITSPTATIHVNVPTPTPGLPATYTLMQGEYPFCIARRFNINPDELLGLNPQIANLPESAIPAGTVLTIPQTGNAFPGDRSLLNHPTTYTVPSGDVTVYRVACYFGDVHPYQIIMANNLTAPYTLHTGQNLVIP